MERFEAHGSHWQALGYQDDTATMGALGRLLDLGTIDESQVRGVDDAGVAIVVSHISYPAEGDVRLVALLVRSGESGKFQICSAYPHLAGVPNILFLQDASPWASAVEAFVGVSTPQGVPFWAFDSLYYRNRESYRTGSRRRFSVAGLALTLRLAPRSPASAPEKPKGLARLLARQPQQEEATLQDLTAFRPSRYLDEFHLRARVLDVGQASVDEQPLYKLKVTLGFEHEDTLGLFLYASPTVTGGYQPRAGDDIEALAWMQVHIADHHDEREASR